jgi:hypothetical protein
MGGGLNKGPTKFNSLQMKRLRKKVLTGAFHFMKVGYFVNLISVGKFLSTSKALFN